jgi:hypothetical protein
VQAITVAIGPVGITYFGQTMLGSNLVTALGRLAPPNRSIDAPDIKTRGPKWTRDCTKIRIDLSGGGMSGFTPTYGGITQRDKGQFQVALSAGGFDATYSWNETWHERFCSVRCAGSDRKGGPFAYSPHFGGLAVQVLLDFKYDQPTNAYDVDVLGTTATPSAVSANVPAASVIQGEEQQCFSSHVSDATAGAVAGIDFGRPIAGLLGPLFKSIPASGHVTPDITYDFAVGPSGLTFPGNQGLAIGVTGAVKYKGEPYQGKPEPVLPVPPVPTDANHLRVYVSSYEFDALNWAFFKAGLLTHTLLPHDVTPADLLEVDTYVSAIPEFADYSGCGMQAQVTPKQPPTTAFQLVWEFTKEAMQLLQQQLPASEYKKITRLDGHNYVTQDDLHQRLKAAGVTDAKSVTIVERATQIMGMVVKHDLEFKLTIQNEDQVKPNLVFDVVRTDVLQNLSLGVTDSGKTKTQTLKYDFKPVTSTGTFVSSTIPGLEEKAKAFHDLIWPVVGEPRYDQALANLGKTGVPLPIMQGFHFLFDHAQLSIQDGYVSVLAQVQFTT